MFATFPNGMRAKTPAFSSLDGQTVFSVPKQCPTAARPSWRRNTAANASKLHEQQANPTSSSRLTNAIQQATIALGASGIAAMMLVCPGPVLAEDLPAAPQQDAQALSVLLPAGSLPGNLTAAEAPGLVADSGSAVLEGVKGIVEYGLQDLAANSMNAVGGPMTGDVLSASVNQAASGSTAAPSELQQQEVPPSAAVLPSTPSSQQQQQQFLSAVWCNPWQAYCEALERSPFATKVYTGVVGTLIGDLAAQILSHTSRQQQQGKPQPGTSRTPNPSSSKGFSFDVMRAGRLCMYSVAIGTPMSHVWYGLLESAVLPATPLAPAAVAAKVVLDQLVQTPFGMALFFAVMKTLEGKPGQVPQELQTKMMPALLANWKLWPAAQLINFTLIPEEQRILYNNIIGICWTCVISNMQQDSAAEGTADSSAGSVANAQQVASAPSASPRGTQESVGRGIPSLTLRRRSSSLAA